MNWNDFNKNFEKKATMGEFEFKKIEFLDLPDHIIRIDTICSVVKGVNKYEDQNTGIYENEYYIQINTKNNYFFQVYVNESERDNDFNRIKSLLFGCMINEEGGILK